jgi:hemerythrin-like domain-containing protein
MRLPATWKGPCGAGVICWDRDAAVRPCIRGAPTASSPRILQTTTRTRIAEFYQPCCVLYLRPRCHGCLRETFRRGGDHTCMQGRNIAIAAGGLAVGVIGSRLLAPMLAMGAGAIRGKSGDPFKKLEDDHRLLLKTLEAMEKIEDHGTAKRGLLFLTLKRKLGKHAMAEEDVVYPLLSEEADRKEAAKHLYEEHAQIKILLFEIENALMHHEGWMQPVRKLRQLIASHIEEEETEQFPRLREVLSAKRVSEVGAQVHREEALVL